MVGERLDVPTRHRDLLPAALRIFALCRDLAEIGQQAPKRKQAIPQLGGHLTRLPDLLENDIEPACPSCCATLHVEDAVRQAIRIGLQPLDDVGLAIDDGLEQPYQNR